MKTIILVLVAAVVSTVATPQSPPPPKCPANNWDCGCIKKPYAGPAPTKDCQCKNCFRWCFPIQE